MAQLRDMHGILDTPEYRQALLELRRAFRLDDEPAVRAWIVRYDAQTMGRRTAAQRRTDRAARQAENQRERTERVQARTQAAVARERAAAERGKVRAAGRGERAAIREEAEEVEAALDPTRGARGAARRAAVGDVAGRVRDAVSSAASSLFGGGRSGGSSNGDTDELPEAEEGKTSLLVPLAVGALGIGAIYLATKETT